MENASQRSSVGKKMYLFIGVTVFLAAFGMAMLAFMISSDQIDRYFKQLTLHSARNFASFVDVEFYTKLREMAESEEYQAIRNEAEENDDEAPIEAYLKDCGLWEGYQENRALLVRYLRNMEDIKYLYIVVWGDKDSLYDMYLMDDDDNPIYETGYYELREEAFLGMDGSEPIEPTISRGDWGWLSSAFYPVYNEQGELICQVGCDVAMNDVMAERNSNLAYILLGAVILTLVVLSASIFLVNRTVVRPLNTITSEMKKYAPAENIGYKEAGVLDLNITSGDEIEDIYQGIRSMQMNIIDYLNDINLIQQDKERAENQVRDRDKQIGEISQEAYKDALTGVGSKAAYVKRIAEMNEQIGRRQAEFAIVMVDVNNLKTINDTYGHTSGDAYLRGCCRVMCEIYKHSPVYRIGGDEFVILVTGEEYKNRNKRLKEMKETFQRFHDDVSAEPWQRYSAAFGMAEYAYDDSTVELVFKRADKAMYANKMEFKKKNGGDHA